MRKPTFFVAALLVLLSLAIAGCSSSSQDNQDAIEASVQATLAAQGDIETAVQATLTAIASESGSAAETTDPPPASSSASASSVAPSVVLPPEINGFNPAPRPASSMGDPNAPVVIYEWSDYT